jgi:hypothetical protein
MTKTKTKPDDEVALPLEARAIRCIADFLAPKTTQDNVDQLGAEYATANFLRMYADKRYETAKKQIIDEYEVNVALVRNEAAEHMNKSTKLIHGEEWQITFAANKPVERVSVDELRTELIKMGISATKIDAAMKAVSKKAIAALTIAATRA